jgi:hypothetical protein
MYVRMYVYMRLPPPPPTLNFNFWMNQWFDFRETWYWTYAIRWHFIVLLSNSWAQ